MRKFVVVGLVVSAVGLGLGMSASPAQAGGWGVSTLDRTPALVAGEELEVGFTFRQHGREPVNIHDLGAAAAPLTMFASGDRPAVGIGITPDGGTTSAGEEEFFEARPDGPVGHYVVDVVFPDAGTYRWKVYQGVFGEQELGRVEVGDQQAGPIVAEPSSTSTGYRGSILWRAMLPILAAAGAAYVVIDVLRRGRAPGRRRAPAPRAV